MKKLNEKNFLLLVPFFELFFVIFNPMIVLIKAPHKTKQIAKYGLSAPKCERIPVEIRTTSPSKIKPMNINR